MRGALTAVFLAGCASVARSAPADNGFRAQLAAGCDSPNSCARLQAAADTRVHECLSTMGADCQDKIADAQAVSDMKRGFDREARDNEAASIRATNRARMDAESKLLADKTALGSSCTDIAKLAALAAASPYPEVAAGYQGAATSRNTERAGWLTSQIQHELAQQAPLRENQNPAGYRAAIAETRKNLDALRCYDALAAQDLQRQVEAWAAAWDKSLTEEEACLASPKCVADRETLQVARQICAAMADKREAQSGMATERANPSGYVDMNALHEYGADIQNADARIAAARKEYAQVAHHPFAGACTKAP